MTVVLVQHRETARPMPDLKRVFWTARYLLQTLKLRDSDSHVASMQVKLFSHSPNRQPQESLSVQA